MAGPQRSTRPPRRTWPERLAIAACVVASVAALVGAASLAAGWYVLKDRQVVTLRDPGTVTVPAATAPTTDVGALPAATSTAGSTATSSADATMPPATMTPTTPEPTFPPADPEASNFLLTGADNGACIDPSSPYAAAFGDREGMGERSDTIMVFRVDPSASRAAVLSFPRDLYVRIADSGNRARINTAYSRDDPQRLIDTIYENFGIRIDHFVQVDFCAFKTLVDSVGGVAVPFEFPARDPHTGLDVPTAGCFTFTGEHALAYVRSRHYEYEDPPGSGEWQTDGSGDLGRISRQQDFIRRVLARILSRGPFNPAVAGGLIESAQEYVVTDDQLSPAKLLEFAGILRHLDPGSFPSYQIEGDPRTIGGAWVLEPDVEGDHMQAILGLFRGETSLGAPPPADDVTATTTAATATPTTDEALTAATSPVTATTSPDPTADATVPTVPEENNLGIVPPRDVSCD